METKQDNWLPVVIVVGAIVLFLNKQQPQPEPSKPSVSAVVKGALPSIREAYRSAFLEAARKIEAGEIKDQEAWTKFISENAGAKYREAMDKVYSAIDELDLPASFEGKESEIAKINRQIAEAW